MHPDPGRTGRKVTTAEAAELLGLSASTLEKARVAGNGPAFLKFGRKVLYDPRDLEEFVQRSRRRSTSQAA